MEHQIETYLLQFPSGFHLSQGGREMMHSHTQIHSDLLASALVAMAARMQGSGWDAQSFLGSFRLTSAFPWAGEWRFLPWPQTGFRLCPTSEIPAKETKKIRWVTVEKWLEAVQTGRLEWDPRKEWSADKALVGAPDLPSAQIAEVRQKVTLRSEPWDYLGQASVEQSLPYFVEEIHFPAGQGVYFRVAFPPEASAENRSLFHAALRLLSEEGIGSARTRGLGHFTYALDDAAIWRQLDALPAGDHHLLLGRMIPTAQDHGALDGVRSSWHLQKVAGYMAAAPREADRLRRKMGQYLLGPGSLLVMPQPPQGRCVNLAPEGYGLPALREGRPFSFSFQPPTV